MMLLRHVAVLSLMCYMCTKAERSPPRAQTNLYDILSCNKNATPDQIRKGYHKASLRWHPDKNAGQKQEAERRFIEVAQAYEVLSDEAKRREYDIALKRSRGGGGGHPHFNFTPFKTEVDMTVALKKFEEYMDHFDIDDVLTNFGEPDPSKQSWTEYILKGALRKYIPGVLESLQKPESKEWLSKNVKIQVNVGGDNADL